MKTFTHLHTVSVDRQTLQKLLEIESVHLIDNDLLTGVLSDKQVKNQCDVLELLLNIGWRIPVSVDIAGNLFSRTSERTVPYQLFRKRMRLLVRLGYQCNAFDLTRGIRWKSVDFVRFLLEMLPIPEILKADIRNEGLISLLFHETKSFLKSETQKTEELLNLLQYSGCDIDREDLAGETALQNLCRRRYAPMRFFEVLLNNGASKRRRYCGRLPFDLARNSNQPIEILNLLRL